MGTRPNRYSSIRSAKGTTVDLRVFFNGYDVEHLEDAILQLERAEHSVSVELNNALKLARQRERAVGVTHV